MRLVDSFRMAAGGLRERKMRTALTVLGIVIGSSMIVALYASTQGQSAAIEDQLGKLGPTTLIVRSREQARFDQSSIETVQGVEGVESAFLAVQGNAAFTGAGLSTSASVMGLDPADLTRLVKGLEVVEGEVYDAQDLTGAFIGATLGAPDPGNGTYVYAGDPIVLTTTAGHEGGGRVTRTLTVSGVAAAFGSSPFVNVDQTVFVPLATGQQLLSINPSQYNTMIVFAQDADQVPALQTLIAEALGGNVIVLSGTQLASTISGVYQSVGTLLGSVAAISLLVAGVGIANTMFVSVLERVTEIGTLKAIGFKAREILGVFLLEASLTGLIGGIVGSIFGVGVAFGIGAFVEFALGGGGGTAAAQAPASGFAGRGGGFGARGGGGGFGGEAGHGPGGGGFAPGGGGIAGGFNMDAQPVFTVDLFVLAILFAVLISVIAGLIPSRKAARLDPVVALKRL